MRASKARRIEPVPSHVALIPDGNRRWARGHMLSLRHGYSYGIKKFMDFSVWAKGFGVRTITVWALSTENIKKRSASELSTLCKLYEMSARDPAILAKLAKNHARIRVVGNLRMLPKRLREALRYLERATPAYKELTINLLVGYGGRDDILHALRSAQSCGGSSVGEDFIAKHIQTASVPDVDLIIRTSGEMRLSGFLPVQSSYSELYFAKKYWPDFNRRDLEKALQTYASRERRFGR